MKIQQVDLNVLKIDDLVINFNEITYSKGLLEKVYDFKKKQEQAVTAALTMAESAKNKLHTLNLAYNRLLALPSSFPLEEFPDTVTIFCNLGDDVNPIYVEYNIDKENVLLALTKNPNFSLTDSRLDNLVCKYFETV